MREINLRSIDLNLLVALKALIEEKHVTRAAERVGLSQPAMSRALARLRELLNDPLLVKGVNGLSLTARASELLQPLQNVFNEINNIVSIPTTDPAAMQSEIIIATRDNEMVTILPQIIKYISKEAPGITLRVIPFTGDNLDLLERQEVDFVISGTESKSATLHRQVIYKEDLVCLVSSKNPISHKNLTIKNFTSMKHCVVTLTGFGVAHVDTVLEQHGLSREIALRIPYFLAAAYIIAESDLIVTLPRRVAEIVAPQKNVVILEPPIKIPGFTIYLYWHTRNQNNVVHKWIRSVVAEIFGKSIKK